MTVKSFPDSDDGHILLKWGVSIKYYVRGEKFQKVQYDPQTIEHKDTFK